VALILGGKGEPNRQINDLMASGSGIVGSGFGRQGGVAVGATVGDQRDEVIDRIEGLKGAKAALMPGLAAAPTVGAGKSGRAFGSAGRVGRGRARGVLGVLVEAGLERADLGRESGELGLKVGNESLKLGDLGLECVTARALGLWDAHTLEVREAVREVLPT